MNDGVRSYAVGDFLLFEFVCFQTEGSWRLWSVINCPSSFCVRVWVVMMTPPCAQHDLLQAEKEEELILDVLVMMMTLLCCPHLSELSLHTLT